MNKTVAAIVVTYNRKELLIRCLDSIRLQTYIPNVIYVVDNLSNDGTPNKLVDEGYIQQLPDDQLGRNQLIQNQVSSLYDNNQKILIHYIRKFENDGGAGGFYEGMKQAYNSGYEWLWLMDDDGVAEKNQLLYLLNMPNEFKYRNALVVDCKNTSRLAFGIKDHIAISEINKEKYILDEANPFNGTLIHRDIPDRIGFVKKEMFIWGDESEYLNRSKEHNFRIVTIVRAIHYHPKNKGNEKNVIPFVKRYRITIKPKLLAHLFYRNLGYISSKYNKRMLVYYLGAYCLYFSLRLNFLEVFRFLNFYNKGIKGNFK